MALKKYRAKRNFSRTPEPRGKVARNAKCALSFVIQKHAASHLHYDFRLELNGVLLSWAIPKGPSLDPADKRLAIHVEDHPLEYGGFEGVIPERQYGAGTVMLWDRGSWRPRDDPVVGYAKGHLKFDLDGEKLKGGWTLVRTHGSKYGGKTGDKAWLLVKEKGAYACAGGRSIVEAAPDSVATGRNVEAIAAARTHVWQSKLSAKVNVKAGAIAESKPPANKKGSRATNAMPEGAVAAKLPAMLSPMLTTLVATAPSGPNWLHEIKYDGYRMLCRIENGKARLFSRSAKDWTAVFAGIGADLAKLPVRTAWIDGEVVVVDAAGRTSFQALQNALTNKDAPLSFFAFDLVYRDGYDLRRVVLTIRKRLLRGIVGDGVGAIRVGPEVQGHGEEFFKQACSLSLEGAICKRADSLYHDGARTRDWVKVKCTRRQEMVIGGFTDPQSSRTGFGALLLGIYDNGKLRYSGKVGTGFDEQSLTKLHKLLVKRERDKPAFVNPPRGFEAKGAHWVKPDLVAEIAFTEWSNAGALRHPSFQGLRADKKAGDVVRDQPQPAPLRESAAKARRTTTTKTAETPIVAGVALSHPEKLYFPEAGITKIDVAQYHERMASWILPHVKDRPLSLVRCPDGWNEQCFYQKHADKSVNAAVDRIKVTEGDGTAMYMGAGNAKALVALVQWGVLELHPWGSRQPRLDRPDRLIFDFDPDEAVHWKDLVTGVELLRTLLRELELEGFLKTTGGKGLHVVVPIRATINWEEAKGFTCAVADFMVRTFSDRFTATVSKARRKGRIFVDYLRNAEGATAIAPYAVRARANAPVSMPIAWEELAKDVRLDHFNLRNAEDHLTKRKRDPWRDFMKTKQEITKTHGKRVGFRL
jgi:bifunctional non-homologous end joining protein LigD